MTPRDPRPLGESGEALARQWLVEQGWTILAANHRTRYGEIDLIVRDARCLCFVEVKTRAHFGAGHPEEGLSLRKRDRMTRMAYAWLARHPVDVVEITLGVVGVEVAAGQVRVQFWRDAFEGTF